MKTDLETLRDTFKFGYESYEASRKEAEEVWDMYHNRQYTGAQLDVLANRGQPAETFNVVKLFARMLLGYYSNVVNTITVSPVQESDVITASLLNDITKYTVRNNRFVAEGDKVKLSALIAGLMVTYIDVKETGKKDQFGRPFRKITINHVPDSEVVLDPLSRKEDYTDARFIHRFKWLSEDQVVKLYGDKVLAELEAYYNHLDIDEAEFAYSYNGEFTGYYKIFNNYLVVQTIIVDDDGRSWSIHWSGETELFRKEITHKEVKFPYRVHRLHVSDKTEYYGIFREVIETQKAINQALIKIQLMVNTQKAFVEEGAVDNIEEFTDSFNRVNAVIEVNDLSGIKIETLTKELLDQYTVIDKAFDRIQRILSINDSFLGMAFASDSGRKVKLQQNATITALRYITGRLEQFYELLGWDIVNLVKQYYTANQVLRIADESTGAKWIEINVPEEVFSGQLDEQGQPIMEFMYEEVLDPASGEPLEDADGNLLVAPIPKEETEIAFTDVDIEINSVAYNDEDEKNQLMMETMLSGQTGQMLAAVNPAGYFQASSLMIRTMKTKHSMDIARILSQTAEALGGSPEAAAQASTIAQGQGGDQSGSLSQEQKLPQNTNEGVD